MFGLGVGGLIFPKLCISACIFLGEVPKIRGTFKGGYRCYIGFRL